MAPALIPSQLRQYQHLAAAPSLVKSKLSKMTGKQLRAGVILFSALFVCFSVYTTNHSVDHWTPRYLTENQLEFVHITKTGGTTIERAACEGGVVWGSMHYGDFFGCHSADIKEWKGLKHNVYDTISPWHAPPRVMKRRVKDELNPYIGAKLFTVVRNPYTRWVSEFYCPFAGYRGDDRHDEDTMNRWIKFKIGRLERAYNNYYKRQAQSHKPWRMEPPLLFGKHFVHQYEYVYDFNGQKLVDHVLHHEHMKTEFDELMERYNYNLTLPSRNEMHTYEMKGQSKLTWKNLRNSTVAAINRFSAPDFGAFGYKPVYDLYQSDTYQPHPNRNVCNFFKSGDGKLCPRAKE